MADQIDINVVVNGVNDLQSLSVAMRTLLLNSTNYAKITKNLDARQRALNAALGNGSQSAGDHAKNLRQVITNQHILGEEIRKTTADLKRFNAMAKAGIGGPGLPAAVENLKKTSDAMKGIKARALSSDLRSVGIEMKRVGKDAQFVGRSLIIGLTTPIIAFGRIGVQNFQAVDKEMTRLKKLMGEFMSEVGTYGPKVTELADAATNLSYEFGIAKEMVLAITGDFAELGINATETLSNLSRLAVQISVLGSMDVSSAKDLTQTLFLGSMNALQMTNRMKEFNTVAEAQAFAVKNVTFQMYMFNSIENATALSMREIAETLPEVSAAGQAFGLNFNEMMSFLAPMKAVGIDVNAAATGIKVSFQKLVNPTIKMTKELQRMSDAARELGNIELAEDFLGIKNIGMDSIQSLVDVTIELSKASDEELLDFYSELFDDRQSTRMLVAMRDLANFQNSMFRTSVGGVVSAEKQFVDMINKALTGSGLLVKDIKSLSEVTSLANISFKQLNESGTMYVESLGREVTRAEIEAAKKARKSVADFISSEMKYNQRNFIEEMSSESGKVLAVSFAGGASASEFASRELEAAVAATSTSIDRIKIAFKNLTAGMINDLAPVIRAVATFVVKLVDGFLSMSPAVRMLIITLAGLAATVGPIVFIFGQLKMSLGVVLEGIMRLIPGLKALSVESLHSRSQLLYLNKPLTMQGQTLQNLNSRWRTFIAIIASGNGPIAKMARTYGQLSGILSKNMTVGTDVLDEMNRVAPSSAKAMKTVTGQVLAGAATATSGVAGATGAVTTPSMATGSSWSTLVQRLRAELVQKPLELMPGPPAPLALPAAGQTGVSPKWTPVRGLGGRFRERMTMSRPMPSTTTQIMGELMPGPPIKSKADLSREAAAARKAAKAARQQLNKKVIAAAVATEQTRISKIVSAAKAMKPFDRRSGSFTDQLFENVGIGGAPGQAGRQFVDDAISREKLRTQTRPRRALRRVLRQTPIARFMPPSVGEALPFEREITTGFMQRKFTGDRTTDKVSRSTKSIKDTFNKAFNSIGNKAKVFQMDVDRSLSKIGSGVGSKMQSASRVAGNALDSIGKKGRSVASSLNSGFSKVGTGVWSKLTAGGNAAFNGLQNRWKKNSIYKGYLVIKDLGSKVVRAFRTHVNAARAAVARLNAEGKGAGLVGFFRKATSASWNFVKSVIVGDMSLKALVKRIASTSIVQFFLNAAKASYAFAKANIFAAFSVRLIGKAFMSIGILAVIMAIVAAVMYLVNVFKNMGDKSKVVSSNLGAAFKSIKDALDAIITPIRDTIGTLIQMISGATGGAQNTGDAFKDVSKKIKDFAESIKEFVEKYIQPIIEFIMVRVIDFIRGAVDFIRGFVEILKGNWKEGLGLIIKGVAKFARIFIDIWMALAKINIDIVARLAKGIVGLIGEAINAIVDGIASLVASVVNLGRNIPFVGGKLKGLADWLNNVEAPMDGITNTVNNLIDTAANAAKGVVDGLGGELLGWIEGIAGAQVDIIDGAGDALKKGSDEALEDSDETFDPWIDASNAAGEEAGENAAEAFKKAFADAMKDLTQKFVDLVLDSLKASIDEATDKLQEALEKQKEKALSVYDAQIKALETLEKAEESLTKEKEYQLERRKMLDERELQRTNYVRNRALAIYEGRIDDARMISLQETADVSEFNRNLSKLDEDRRRDLVSENLGYLKDAIKSAQEETEKLIDEQITKFQEAAKEITKFPPLTIEEYTSQLEQLNNIAVEIAGENGNILKAMMDSMAVNLRMPNENLGVFSTGLDQLVTIAQQKYGLLGNPDTDTIVGATIAMLTGIQGQLIGYAPTIANAFQGIVTDVFDVASTFSQLAAKVVAPALAEIQSTIIKNNPFTAFENAVKFANETILREMQKTVGHVGSLVDGLTRHISSVLIELTRAQVALEQAAQQAQDTMNNTPLGGGGGGSDSTSGTNGNTLDYAAGAKALADSIASLTTSYLRGRIDTTHANSLMTVIQNITPIAKEIISFGATRATEVANYLKATGQTTTFPWNHIYYLLTNSAYVNAIRSLPIYSFANGGFVKNFANGGSIVPGFQSQSVPAMLHGGEFVMNSKAVSNIGIAALQALNNMRNMSFNENALQGISRMKYDVPGQKAVEVLSNLSVGRHGYTTQETSVTKTENINIYVENFVGQEEWFKSMVKQYNMTVLPMKQKSAGMENRVVTSYTGLSRGM